MAKHDSQKMAFKTFWLEVARKSLYPQTLLLHKLKFPFRKVYFFTATQLCTPGCYTGKVLFNVKNVSVKWVEVVERSYIDILPLPLLSCESWMCVKENPDRKNNNNTSTRIFKNYLQSIKVDKIMDMNLIRELDTT